MTKTTILPALTLAAVATAAVVSALPATAQDDAMPPMAAMGPPDAMLLFEMIDTDGDGRITAAEIAAFRAAGVAGSDANGDGKLSAEELAAQQLAMMRRIAEVRAARMVAELDLDGDGLLSVEELAARPMPVLRLERLDRDGDGVISREEAEQAQARMRGGRGPGLGGWQRGGHHGGHRRAEAPAAPAGDGAEVPETPSGGAEVPVAPGGN
jgi:hypothetical protein